MPEDPDFIIADDLPDEGPIDQETRDRLTRWWSEAHFTRRHDQDVIAEPDFRQHYLNEWVPPPWEHATDSVTVDVTLPHMDMPRPPAGLMDRLPEWQRNVLDAMMSGQTLHISAPRRQGRRLLTDIFRFVNEITNDPMNRTTEATGEPLTEEMLYEALREMREREQQLNEIQDAVMAEWIADLVGYRRRNETDESELSAAEFRERAHARIDQAEALGPNTDDSENYPEPPGSISTDELIDLIGETLIEYREERDA